MAMSASPVEVLKPSKEKTNYIRITRLLISGGTKIVREVFDSIIPPAQLPAMLSKSTVLSRLNQMRLKKVLTYEQWNVLFPSPSTYGKSKSFDITLLFKLLRERKFCGLSAPTPGGWDKLPDDKDHSLPADLARIKWYRNELCHTNEDMGISDSDFKTYGERIKNALLNMSKPLTSTLGPSKDWEDEIEKLLTGPITDDEKIFIEQLKSWFDQDMQVKDLLQELPHTIVNLLEEKDLLKRKDHDDYGEHLVTFLQEYYSKGEWSLILPFPWMEGDRFHIENQYASLNIVDQQYSKIDMANLFSPNKGSQDTRRVLIEGEGGIGKSTFCKKIAYDWSKDKLQIPDVDLVLVIHCCDLKDGDVWQAIKEQNLPEDLRGAQEAEEVFNYIRKNQQKVLLIVDGFDEIPATAQITMKESIKALVTRKLLSKARVVLTSRPERCSDIRKCFDKKLQMFGFSWDDSCHFLKHFGSSSYNIDETIAYVEKTSALRELTRCPLNAAFLCLILEEKGSDDTFFKSLDIGSLYSEMVFCVLKRYCVAKKRQEVQDDTLMGEYHEVLVLLGKIAFNLMKDNLTNVTDGELPVDERQILRDIGFLIESKLLNTIRPSSRYCFSHSSIKEYFAALYVAECLTKGSIHILTSIQMSPTNPSSTGIGHSNHVQNIYYSLQRFNLPKLANLPNGEEYIKLINGLAAQLPKDIDLSQTELTRFDFIFSLICEFLGNCKGDQATKVLKEIAIQDLPVVFYLYNGRQALDGLVSLLSQSNVKIKIKILRLEGLQVFSSSSIQKEDFINFSRVLGEHKFLETLYLSFFSNPIDMVRFFDNFKSTSVENLSLLYIPEGSKNVPEGILRNLSTLSSLDLSNSLLSNVLCIFEVGALKVLKLCHCNLRSSDVIYLYRCLRHNTTLRELDLSGNYLSGEFHLFDLKDSTLQVLRMSSCNLRSSDVHYFFRRCLRHNTTLRELDLSGNDLSGVRFHLFDLKGSTLQVLRMSSCNLRSSDFIHRFLCHNTTLRELDLSGNAIEVEQQTLFNEYHFRGINILF